MTLDLDNDGHYVLTPKPELRANPMPLVSKNLCSALIRNTFKAQEAGTYSNAELTIFWSRNLFANASDSTLKFLGEAISHGFLATTEKPSTVFYKPPNRSRFNL